MCNAYPLNNLLTYSSFQELRKLLNVKLNLNFCKIKAPGRGSPWAYVCFRNQEDRELAIKTLTGYKWKGKVLTASEAKPAPDPLVKRRNEQSENDLLVKKRKTIVECTTPLAHLDYQEQVGIYFSLYLENKLEVCLILVKAKGFRDPCHPVQVGGRNVAL